MIPARVRFSRHADRRIRKRRLDHRHITHLMYSLPYEDGTWHWDDPDSDMRIVFVDEMRMRTVITAMRRYESY
jgi:hypothetical protein